MRRAARRAQGAFRVTGGATDELTAEQMNTAKETWENYALYDHFFCDDPQRQRGPTLRHTAGFGEERELQQALGEERQPRSIIGEVPLPSVCFITFPSRSSFWYCCPI